MVCRRCGTHLQDDAKFCPQCGLKIDQLVCHSCGRALMPNMKFCDACGSKIVEPRVAEAEMAGELSENSLIVDSIEDSGISSSVEQPKMFEEEIIDVSSTKTYSWEYRKGRSYDSLVVSTYACFYPDHLAIEEKWHSSRNDKKSVAKSTDLLYGNIAKIYCRSQVSFIWGIVVALLCVVTIVLACLPVLSWWLKILLVLIAVLYTLKYGFQIYHQELKFVLNDGTKITLHASVRDKQITEEIAQAVLERIPRKDLRIHNNGSKRLAIFFAILLSMLVVGFIEIIPILKSSFYSAPVDSTMPQVSTSVSEVETVNSDPTPEPTVVPNPTATATPVVTATPRPVSKLKNYIGKWYATSLDDPESFPDYSLMDVYGIELEVVEFDGEFFAYLKTCLNPLRSSFVERERYSDTLIPIEIIDDSHFQITYDVDDHNYEGDWTGTATVLFTINAVGDAFVQVDGDEWCGKTQAYSLDEWMNGEYRYFDFENSVARFMEIEGYYSPVECEEFLRNCFYTMWIGETGEVFKPVGNYYFVSYSTDDYRTMKIEITFYDATDMSTLHSAVFYDCNGEYAPSEMWLDGVLFTNMYS